MRSSRHDQAGSDVPAADLEVLDAFKSLGKDDCLCALHAHARAQFMQAAQRFFRDCGHDVDFPESESDDLLAAARSVHLEGRTNGSPCGREIAACAAAGAQIQTRIQGGGSSMLQAGSERERIAIFFLRDRPGGHPGESVCDFEDAYATAVQARGGVYSAV